MQGGSLKDNRVSSFSGRSYYRGCVAYCILLCLFGMRRADMVAS